ncbi:hypothetical protein Bbelb_179010 [Branchiostoma belcheri]|nr:hypothetical protein Bbelb_179010 [Branchiostoma belcheri]
MGNMSQVNLSHNRLTHLGKHYFTGLRRITTLDLSFNKIQDIEKGSFENMGFAVLDLKGNKLKSIKSCFFFGITMEVSMWFSVEENLISTIEAGAFSSIEGLTTLQVRDNELVFLWESWLRGLSSPRFGYKGVLFYGQSTLRCTCANRWFVRRGKMKFEIVPTAFFCKYPLSMEGEDIFSIAHLPCPSPVVKITQDIDDHDVQFRCQATWEEESSIFWVLPDNTTIVLPGLGEDKRNANLTSQHFNISFQHDISACGWTWEAPSRVTTHCSHDLTAPNYAVKTVSVLVLPKRLVQKWNGTSIHCGVKSFSSDVVARRELYATFLSNKSKSQAKTASPGLMSLSYPPTPPDDATATLTYYSSVVQSENTSQAIDNTQTIKEIATSLYEVYAPVTTSILTNTNSIDVDDYVILLPSETHKRLHPNYFIASGVCTVPFALIFAACIYLQNRRYSITEDETVSEQEGGHQQRNNDASVPENQRDNSVSDTIADPYYSTINDSHENDETVEPYGVAKVCPQYGRAETRSSDVREHVDAD